jgi:hypothetical protein
MKGKVVMAIVKPKHPMHGQRNAALARPEKQTHLYEIMDPDHKADLRGELGGGKVFLKDGKQHVRLTEAQAKFYVDARMLRRVQHHNPDQQPPQASQAPRAALAAPSRTPASDRS